MRLAEVSNVTASASGEHEAAADWRQAMLIASDGEVYGPARLTALQTCDYVTDEEAHNWRARIAAHHHAQNEDASDDAADADADAVAPEVCLLA